MVVATVEFVVVSIKETVDAFATSVIRAWVRRATGNRTCPERGGMGADGEDVEGGWPVQPTARHRAPPKRAAGRMFGFRITAGLLYIAGRDRTPR
jgi:hypothetical protein